ncbi:hypothetical protein CC86DRAFT_373009 [Ophiobolus disseminans]|uniref:Uncharacterized protein n=1 Tax=Ophiobolus disseminans TaxID=1469910 RepID=A0A6A6ZQ11_9PLEO|nr:hypothetical protein CC86DRAFT_373009 [Ophiobolus disseminans]
MFDTPSKPFPFLALPLELRESIYSLYFKPSDRLVRNVILEKKGYYGGVYRFDVDLYCANKQIYAEASQVWRRENVFIKISTPWPSAGMYRVYLLATDGRDFVDAEHGGTVEHIASEGLVPIVCANDAADSFNTHLAHVQITAPFHQAVPEHSVIVLLDDLHLFTQTWYYSALSYPMLNERLTTACVLRDPAAHPEIQRRLLYPFEQVKGLYHMDIAGYNTTVTKELRRRMAIPIPTVTECCEQAEVFMEHGDQALALNNTQEALDLFGQSFKAIHILIHNRTRRVLADMFFRTEIESGRYANQSGMTVRIILRLKLVSRYILAYLKLGQWGEAAFWGMRSIRIMRESMDTEYEDFLGELVGGEDVAMIYVRTGLAFWNMRQDVMNWHMEINAHLEDELADTKSLWDLSKKYLKGRSKGGVRKELEGLGVPGELVSMFGDEDVKAEASSTIGQDGSGEE